MRLLLKAVSNERPVVVLLDDLHWADEPSLELLDALLRRPPRGRVLLAGAYRPRQVPRRLTEALVAEAVCLELGPLDLSETRALLGDRIDDATLATLHRQSGGVPSISRSWCAPGTEPTTAPTATRPGGRPCRRCRGAPG